MLHYFPIMCHHVTECYIMCVQHACIKIPKPIKAERTEKVANFWEEYSKTVDDLKNYSKTVYIPANSNMDARSFFEGHDDETVFIPAN